MRATFKMLFTKAVSCWALAAIFLHKVGHLWVKACLLALPGRPLYITAQHGERRPELMHAQRDKAHGLFVLRILLCMVKQHQHGGLLVGIVFVVVGSQVKQSGWVVV